MKFWQTLRQAGRFWVEDNAAYLSAAVAYYALFSVAPLAVLAVDLSAIAYGEAAAQNRLADFLENFIGPGAAQGVQNLVLQVRQPAVNWWTGLLAFGLLLFTAANLFVQVQKGLFMIWKLPPVPGVGVIHGTVSTYLAAIAMVVVVGLFGMTLLIGSTFLGFFIEWSGDWLPGGPLVWRLGDLVLMLCLVSLLVALTFRLLSERRIPWQKLWRGAVVTTLLLVLGKIAFAWYIYFMGSNLATVYGAASSLIVFLIWVYYCAQILFLGAEVIRVDQEYPAAQPA